MPKITKITGDNLTTYFYDGVKKYGHYKDSKGNEGWEEYDEQGNITHYKDSDGREYRREYDEQGNMTHYKDDDGYEKWIRYGEAKEIKEEDIKPFEFE